MMRNGAIMRDSIRDRAGVLVSVALTSILLVAPAVAQDKTLFCIQDGTQIAADRFETRDGKFFLYVQGASEPLQ